MICWLATWLAEGFDLQGGSQGTMKSELAAAVRRLSSQVRTSSDHGFGIALNLSRLPSIGKSPQLGLPDKVSQLSFKIWIG